MARLIIYPTPLNARCQLQHDSGWAVDGIQMTNNEGRPGVSFEVPNGTPNRWGCRLVITADKKVSIMQRGLLVNEGSEWFLYADDFIMQDVPPPVVIPPPTLPPNPPNTALSPYQIIQGVYASGAHTLETKAGCGTFTEACCKELHERHSVQWGHVKKTGAQNQFNGHAVDAVQLLTDVLTSTGLTRAGIYDIIMDSESPNAEPAFNWAGDPRPDLWYYNG